MHLSQSYQVYSNYFYNVPVHTARLCSRDNSWRGCWACSLSLEGAPMRRVSPLFLGWSLWTSQYGSYIHSLVFLGFPFSHWLGNLLIPRSQLPVSVKWFLGVELAGYETKGCEHNSHPYFVKCRCMRFQLSPSEYFRQRNFLWTIEHRIICITPGHCTREMHSLRHVKYSKRFLDDHQSDRLLLFLKDLMMQTLAWALFSKFLKYYFRNIWNKSCLITL